jgi:hypothetical protein
MNAFKNLNTLNISLNAQKFIFTSLNAQKFNFAVYFSIFMQYIIICNHQISLGRSNQGE